MTRLPPEDLDWDVVQQFTYRAELALELYLQGRPPGEVADLTSFPVVVVVAFAHLVGMLRDDEEEAILGQWRVDSFFRLAELSRDEVVGAWIEGEEVDDLAARHHVQPDVLWDFIAAEMSWMTKTEARRWAKQPTKRRNPVRRHSPARKCSPERDHGPAREHSPPRLPQPSTT